MNVTTQHSAIGVANSTSIDNTLPRYKVLIIDLDHFSSVIDDEIPCWNEAEAKHIAKEQEEMLTGTSFRTVVLAF